MGYNVYRKGKSFFVHWESQTDGKKLKRQVRIEEWSKLGFSREKSFEENQTVAKTLNSIERIRKEEEKRNRLEQARLRDALVECIALPAGVVEEFERVKLAKSSKKGHWEVVKKMVRELSLVPKDWRSKREKIWDWWIKRKLSPSYARELRGLLNRYSEFYGEKTGLNWSVVPAPSGTYANELKREYERFNATAKRKRRRPSGRLSFKLLRQHKSRFSKEEYYWLYISIAFGLRPEEIDNSLTDKEKWRLTKRGLHVYQYKLERYENVSWDKRWKLIPLVTKKQRIAIRLVKSSQFKKPGWKKLRGIKDYRGRQVHFNAGRKEFSPYMQEMGFNKADVSLWLGHKSIDTTTEHYDDPTSYAPKEDDEAA